MTEFAHTAQVDTSSFNAAAISNHLYPGYSHSIIIETTSPAAVLAGRAKIYIDSINQSPVWLTELANYCSGSIDNRSDIVAVESHGSADTTLIAQTFLKGISGHIVRGIPTLEDLRNDVQFYMIAAGITLGSLVGTVHRQPLVRVGYSGDVLYPHVVTWGYGNSTNSIHLGPNFFGAPVNRYLNRR